jgi:DNA-binding transcriptional MerR regulator
MRKIINSVNLSEKFNLPYSTVTHYTNLGLLRVIGRKGKKRLYDEGEVRGRLAQIKKLVNEGYPLMLIRDKIFQDKA